MKYRVKFYESERGWGSDTWTRDYANESDALQAVIECNAKYMWQTQTPDYYIKATYIGAVEV